MHQASLYQMNDPPETTTSRHCAFHHARPQFVRIRSILERSRNGTHCLTVLSLPRVLNHSRLSSSLSLNDTVFICTVYKFYLIASKYVQVLMCAPKKVAEFPNEHKIDKRLSRISSYVSALRVYIILSIPTAVIMQSSMLFDLYTQ